MQELRTFRGATVGDAIAQVKKSLGAHAVIVNTRSYRNGAVMGLGGKPVVEIVASAPSQAAHPGAPTLASSRGRLRSALASVYAEVPTRRSPIAVQVPERDHSASPAPDAPPTATGPRTAVPAPMNHPRPAPRLRGVPVDPAPTDPGAVESLRDELGSIKRMVGQLLRCSSRPTGLDGSPPAVVVEAGGLPEALFAQYTRLIDAGVETNFAQTVLAAVRNELSQAQAADPAIARAAVLAELARLIPCAPILAPGPGQAARRSAPLAVALIGATGAGKTTTIAKLAAEYALRRGLRIALVTSDTYRIGAVEQLREYAQIIGVPLHVAATPPEMDRTISRIASATQPTDVILIDTAGRSPADPQRVDELRDVIDAARPDHRLLVLSASASPAAMARIAERFAALRPDRLVVSKLDEAGAMGVLTNVPRTTGLPVSHFTTGQDVPDFLEEARPERLAMITLDGEIGA